MSGGAFVVSRHPPAKSGLVYEAVVNLDPNQPTAAPILSSYRPESANALLNAAGDQAWIVNEDRIHRYDVTRLDQPELVFELPKEVARGRKVFRLVTDLTRTCDQKHFILDSWVGNQYHIAAVEVATGAQVTRHLANDHSHTICSRHDPNLFLINQGHWIDPITGCKTEMQVRIWLMSLDGSVYQPLTQNYALTAAVMPAMNGGRRTVRCSIAITISVSSNKPIRPSD